MALLHKATLDPTKRELMTAWLATRPWAEGFDPHQTIASYRFDDPAGEVGLEGALLVNDAGTVVHVPLSYRAAPLEGADAFLVGTAEHSVLGRRWVYDACGDPVWATALATAIATGGGGAEQYFEVDGERVMVEPRMSVQGSGDATVAVPDIGVIDDVRDDGPTTATRCGDLELVVVRMVGADIVAEQTLTGRWGDASGVLAGLRGA
jgi:Maltokinase N-terminal cap domain